MVDGVGADDEGEAERDEAAVGMLSGEGAEEVFGGEFAAGVGIGFADAGRGVSVEREVGGGEWARCLFVGFAAVDDLDGAGEDESAGAGGESGGEDPGVDGLVFGEDAAGGGAVVVGVVGEVDDGVATGEKRAEVGAGGEVDDCDGEAGGGGGAKVAAGDGPADGGERVADAFTDSAGGSGDEDINGVECRSGARGARGADTEFTERGRTGFRLRARRRLASEAGGPPALPANGRSRQSRGRIAENRRRPTWVATAA